MREKTQKIQSLCIFPAGCYTVGMNRQDVREATRTKETTAPPSQQPVRFGALRFDPAQVRPKAKPVPAADQVMKRKIARKTIQRTQQRIAQRSDNQRFQHELREMQETDDLREVDDDVEDVATMLEWRAEEHNHQPKSATWYAVLAGAITVISVGFLLFGNIIAAITIGFVGAMTYFVAQKDPAVIRYRLLTEGIAFNNMLYHYRDLDAFNIVYEPGHTKTVLLRSNRTFSPLLHMEIGEADPVAIRDVLIEFVREDQDLNEPLVDIWARRLGF